MLLRERGRQRFAADQHAAKAAGQRARATRIGYEHRRE